MNALEHFLTSSQTLERYLYVSAGESVSSRTVSIESMIIFVDLDGTSKARGKIERGNGWGKDFSQHTFLHY
jgi:hypothetical protein